MSKKLSLNKQHEYITLRTPNGNYTNSFSGAKASGRLALDSNSFNAIDGHVQNLVRKGKTYGAAMETLLDESILSILWPDWNKEYPNNFTVEDVVIVPTNKKMGQGKIVEITKRGKLIVLFPGAGRVQVDGFMVEKVL